MEVLLASTNPHKLQEFREILEPLGVAVVDLASLSESFDEPVEDAPTFAGNARLKALGYAANTGRVCVADDSGLSVDALDGRPGVMSARFAGSIGTRDEMDAANNAMLLALMEGVPDDKRSARFECAVCVADPSGTIIAESQGHTDVNSSLRCSITKDVSLGESKVCRRLLSGIPRHSTPTIHISEMVAKSQTVT